MRYGLPYKGSKNKIAEEILNALPCGNRLVDLFGGGFAITHCALVKYAQKWKRFVYNDINPLLHPLIIDAINGKYTGDYKPSWISRDDFYRLKETDGYVKWLWSFGNNGNDYLYGRDHVYYSSYDGSPGEIIWEKEVRSIMNSAKGNVIRKECLYML